MKRNRNRYFTIEAENEEEYIKEYEKITKSKLSQMNFKCKSQDYDIKEDDEEDNLSIKKKVSSFKISDLDDDDGYDGLAGPKDLNESENLSREYEENDVLKDSEDAIINRENFEEKGIELLCLYLKNSVIEQSKDKKMKNYEKVFYKNNVPSNSLSGNAIYDLNMRALIEDIMAENNNEYTRPSEGNNNSLKDYIMQNIESDKILKVMIMSNNNLTKNLLLEKFFGKQHEIKKDEISDSPFEIWKKKMQIFNKNISLQILDTSNDFHKNPSISNIYYKSASAFFIFIEATKSQSKEYLDFIFEKINKYFNNKTCVLFGVNMLFKQDCTIDNLNLREYANEKDIIYMQIKADDFNMKNKIILNLFNLIIIKGIDSKSNSKESLRKGTKEKYIGGYKNHLTENIKDSSQKKYIYDITKMNIPNSLGYKKKYRIRHINAFDIDDYYHDDKKKRKFSVDI